MTTKNHNRSKERGNTILEFAIVAPCLVLLFFGSIGLGIMLGRYVQCVQVARDVAHMYSDGVDFSQTSNQNIVINLLANGTGMTANGGNGVIYLSQIRTVYQVDCNAAGITPCTNLNLPVFVQRLMIGNTTLRASVFGTPNTSILDAQGNISPSVYLSNSDSSVLTTHFESTLDTATLRATGTTPTPPAQAQGDTAYVVEVVFQYPDIGFLGWSTAGVAYASFIFH
jgi:Flp pilus assembly protein TadG